MYFKNNDVSVFLNEKSILIIVKAQQMFWKIYKNSNPMLDIMQSYEIRIKVQSFFVDFNL